MTPRKGRLPHGRRLFPFSVEKGPVAQHVAAKEGKGRPVRRSGPRPRRRRRRHVVRRRRSVTVSASSGASRCRADTGTREVAYLASSHSARPWPRPRLGSCRSSFGIEDTRSRSCSLPSSCDRAPAGTVLADARTTWERAGFGPPLCGPIPTQCQTLGVSSRRPGTRTPGPTPRIPTAPPLVRRPRRCAIILAAPRLTRPDGAC